LLLQVSDNMEALKRKIIKYAPPVPPLPQLSEDTKTYTLAWTKAGLAREGESRLSYEIKHVTGLFSSGPEFTLISRTDVGAGAVIGTFGWSMTSKVKMAFPSHGAEITYRALNGHFDAYGGLGRVTWLATGMDGRQASWRLSDSEGNLLSLVEIHASGETGTIQILRMDLPREAFEEVLLSSLAQIEDNKRMWRNAKKSAVAATVSATGLVVLGAS
jgi:hypothetical protein